MKTKGKIENPMGVKSLIFTENEVRLGVDAVVLGNYNATSLTPYISVGDSSYFMDNLVNTDPILQLDIPENYGNTIFSNVLNVRTICLELDGNKSDETQPIPTNSENKMIYIPKGVAHGFQALENDCWLLYLHTEKYSPKAEMGHNPLDPRLSIKWPISNFEMSDKDLNRKYI